MIIEQIIRDTGVAGHRIVGFGDGFVEIEEVKKVGGLAIGVASNEETRSGINAWKRNRLITSRGGYHRGGLPATRRTCCRRPDSLTPDS